LENEDREVPNTEESRVNQEKDKNDVNNTNNINTVSSIINDASIEDNAVDEDIVYRCAHDLNIPNLKEIVYSDDDKGIGAEADMTNLDTHILVSPIITTRIHKDHPVEQIIGDLHLAPQTRRMTKNVTEHGMLSSVQQRINHKDFQNCLFACFLSQAEPKKVIQALQDPSWIEAMQEELLQFKLQQVWTLVDLPHGKRAIGTKWVYRNKKDERGIVIRNKARIEAIRLFLAYASFKDFVVYQMDVKSAFLYGKIEEEVYVCQTLRFEDLEFPDKVYKVEKALYGLHQAPRACQDMYVDEILKKFGFSTMKTASTPMETSKPLLKDAKAKNVDVHLYRSMIGSLMYLIALRHDIIFAVCQPKLGLWYPKDSPFDLEAYTDSDYAGLQTVVANSTTEAEYVAASNETIYKECKDRMERAVTTTSSLEAEQDSGNINRTQSMAKLNESFPQGTSSGSGPRCQDTILGV
ncbi:putative ribonuclease H-like domain-containing protein, partial [Tanacetum coccineum]